MDHPLGPDYGNADGAVSGSGSHRQPSHPDTPPAQPDENTRLRSGAARKLRRS